MANDKPDDGTQSNQQLAFSLRLAVAAAYGFVKGQENTQSFTAFTFEDAMDAQIERIEGQDTQARPNALNRIANVKSIITAAVTQIKSLPAELFNKPDATTDVNTPPEG